MRNETNALDFLVCSVDKEAFVGESWERQLDMWWEEETGKRGIEHGRDSPLEKKWWRLVDLMCNKVKGKEKILSKGREDKERL